jgi:hypothetical protein
MAKHEAAVVYFKTFSGFLIEELRRELSRAVSAK